MALTTGQNETDFASIEKEPFLPTLIVFQSQTQGSLSNISKSQTHVDSDRRGLPVSLCLENSYLQVSSYKRTLENLKVITITSNWQTAVINQRTEKAFTFTLFARLIFMQVFVCCQILGGKYKWIEIYRLNQLKSLAVTVIITGHYKLIQKG